MPSVSNCISRSAAKPIISRRNVASERFSQKREKAILSSVIVLIPGFRLLLDNSTQLRFVAMATHWTPTPRPGTRPQLAGGDVPSTTVVASSEQFEIRCLRRDLERTQMEQGI